MPRRVVVVGEELREQQVHVGALGTVRERVLAVRLSRHLRCWLLLRDRLLLLLLLAVVG